VWLTANRSVRTQATIPTQSTYSVFPGALGSSTTRKRTMTTSTNPRATSTRWEISVNGLVSELPGPNYFLKKNRFRNLRPTRISSSQLSSLSTMQASATKREVRQLSALARIWSMLRTMISKERLLNEWCIRLELQEVLSIMSWALRSITISPMIAPYQAQATTKTTPICKSVRLQSTRWPPKRAKNVSSDISSLDSCKSRFNLLLLLWSSIQDLEQPRPRSLPSSWWDKQWRHLCEEWP